MHSLSSIFQNENGKKIVVNEMVDQVVLLKNVDSTLLDKIGIEIKQYYQKRYLEKIRNLDQRKDESDSKNKSILAFSYNLNSDRVSITFSRTSLPILKEYFGYSSQNPNSNFTGDQYISAHNLYDKHLKSLNVEQQQSLFDELLEKFGENTFRHANKTEAFYSQLVDALINRMKVKDVEDVFNKALRLNTKKQYFYKEFMELLPQLEGGTQGTSVQLKQTLVLISMALHREGTILLPFFWTPDFWIDSKSYTLFDSALKIMSPKFQQELTTYGKIHFDKDKSISSFIGLYMFSNITKSTDYSPKLKYVIIEIAKKAKSHLHAKYVSSHLSKLQLHKKSTDDWIDYDPTLKVTLTETDTLITPTYSSIYTNEFDKKITVNQYTDRVILLKDINNSTLNKIGIKVKKFLVDEYLQNLRTVSHITLHKKDKEDQTIKAFVTHKVNGIYINFSKINIKLLKIHFGYSPIDPNNSSYNTISIHDFYIKHIQHLNFMEQQELYDNLLKEHGRDITQFANDRELLALDLADALINVIKVQGPEHVYNKALLLSKEGHFYRLFTTQVLRIDTHKRGTKSEINQVLVMVGMQLRRYNILLFPFLWIKSIWPAAGLEKVAINFMSTSTKKTLKNYKHLSAQIAELSVAYEINTVVGLYLCSTIDSHQDFTPMLKYIILNKLEKTKQRTLITTVKTHLNRLQSYAMASGDITEWREFTPKRDSKEIVYLTKELELYPHLKEWIQLANTYLQMYVAKNKKSVDQYETSIKKWILFLSTLESPPLKPIHVSRKEHIKNIVKSQSTKLFYNFILNDPVSDRHRNHHLRRVQSFFNFLKDDLFYEIEDLLLDSDKLYLGGQRNKTARKRIPGSLLKIAKELLFEKTQHIQTFKPAMNEMYNHDTNLPQVTYWPGYKNLMKILLYLPLRNKQARWLDSGELDEYIIDYETMDYIKNPSVHSIKGRRSCVLQIGTDPITLEKHFAIYIPINKTGPPYIIPYAPIEIINAIKDQQAFNLTWARPLTKAIRSVDKKSKEPEKTSQLHVDICPLFRLPITKNLTNQAISGEKLMAFYIHLLEGVQAIANKEGMNIVLVSHQPGSSRKKALFDIHSLRVTGISELIEAGVPPDIIAEFVAGHANQVMTLYYNITRYARIREELEKAQNSLKAKESILSLMEDLEELEEFMLVNEEDGEKELAFSLLSEENGLMDIALDGICPGVSCSSVGRDDKCCPKCPVWITGPAFLVGQTMKINTLIYAIRKSSEKLAASRKEAVVENNLIRKHHLNTQVEKETQILEKMLSEWGLRYRFIQRSLAITNDFDNYVNSRNTNKSMVMLTTDVESPKVQLEESDELGILNHICQAGALFEEMSIKEAQFDLENILNKLLLKNGIYPFLIMLDQETAKKTSLMLVDGLLAKYNSSELLKMADGNKLLETEDKEFIKSHITDTNNTMIQNTIFLEEHNE